MVKTKATFTFIIMLMVLTACSRSPNVHSDSVLGKWELVESPNEGIWIFESNGNFRIEEFATNAKDYNEISSMLSTLLFPTNGKWMIRQEKFIDITPAEDPPIGISIEVHKISDQIMEGEWGNQNPVKLKRFKDESNNAP